MSQPVGGFHDFFTLGGLFLGQAIPTIPPRSSSRGRFAGGRQYLAYLHERRRSPIRRIRPMAAQIILADAFTDLVYTTEMERKQMASRATWSAVLAEA
jgi:hypothetical protein